VKKYFLSFVLAVLVVLAGLSLRNTVAAGTSEGTTSVALAIGTSPIPKPPVGATIGTSPIPKPPVGATSSPTQ